MEQIVPVQPVQVRQRHRPRIYVLYVQRELVHPQMECLAVALQRHKYVLNVKKELICQTLEKTIVMWQRWVIIRSGREILHKYNVPSEKQHLKVGTIREHQRNAKQILRHLDVNHWKIVVQKTVSVVVENFVGFQTVQMVTHRAKENVSLYQIILTRCKQCQMEKHGPAVQGQ